jgi:hypothetical protein
MNSIFFPKNIILNETKNFSQHLIIKIIEFFQIKNSLNNLIKISYSSR